MSKNWMSPKAVILGLVLMIVLFGVLEVVIPTVNSSLNNLASNNTGVPFISFFASNGLVVPIIMAGVLLGIVGYLGIGGSKR